MPIVNTVVIAGNLTRDPEMKHLPSGTAVASLGLASNRWYRDKAGEWQQDTTFVDVKCWSQLAERVGEKLRKGAPVLVEGSIKSEHWETPDGAKRSKVLVNATKVQFLERVEQAAAVEAGSVDPADLPF
jgi:single-strand DNA-binding protein